MSQIASLDAHEQPSEALRQKWKAYARASVAALEQSGDIDEMGMTVTEANDSTPQRSPPLRAGPRQPFSVAGTLPADRVAKAYAQFLADSSSVDGDVDPSPDNPVSEHVEDPRIYAHPLLPGLFVVPRLVPPRVQTRLLDRLLHRDLAHPSHQTNMHLHYTLPYPPDGTSFFSYAPSDGNSVSNGTAGTFVPKDPAIHRPLAVRTVLDRRLHWVTLGGQYDWTQRVYSNDGNAAAIVFPPDLAHLLAGLFPATAAQAAIVNLYSPGDTMMLHRDVSETSDRGLISLSLGCDALFMAAPTREFSPPTSSSPNDHVLLRLRSGDALYMTGHARFAWHGVPKVLRDTCPQHLVDWPAGTHADSRYDAWRGWMRNKRVNLNVRQMHELHDD